MFVTKELNRRSLEAASGNRRKNLIKASKRTIKESEMKTLKFHNLISKRAEREK